jgi:hypothetical protein
MPTEQEIFNSEIAGFVNESVDGVITSVEENCGSFWITTDEGKTYSIMVMECEPEEDDFKHTQNQFDTPEQD